MPKRPDVTAEEAEKQVKEAQNAKKAEKPDSVKNEKKDEKPAEERKKVQKSPLQEKFKKFCEEARKGLSTKIQDISERMVTDEGEKFPVIFAIFSTNGPDDAEVDSEFNTTAIKDVLFFYHTAVEKNTVGKAVLLEVMPPDEEDEDPAYILCYHEE